MKTGENFNFKNRRDGMKIVLEKNLIKNVLFYFTYSIYLGYNLLEVSFYLKDIQEYKWTLMILVIVLLVFKEVMDFKFNFRDLIFILLLFPISVLFYKYLGYIQALLPCFIYSARNVNIRTILKLSYRISLVLLLFIIMSSYLGWITYYIAYSGGRVRDYLGFRYSLFAPSIFCNIIFLKIYLEKDNIKWRTLIFLSTGNYLLYLYTDSRLTFGLGMIILILTVIIKIFPRFKHLIMNKLIVGVYIISGGISLYFTIGYNYLVEWQSNINDFLGGRLALGYSTLNYYGYGILGRKITLVGNGLDADGYGDIGIYDYVDNLYVQMLLKLGIIFLFVFIIGMTITMIQIYRFGDVYLYIIFSLLALHGVIDDLILLPQYNSFWFVIAALFYRNITNIRKNEKELS